MATRKFDRGARAAAIRLALGGLMGGLFLAGVAGTSGCASMTRPAVSAERLPENPAPAERRSGATYKVIMTGYTSSEPKIFVGTVQGPLTIQQALQDSGAIDSYGGMTIDLARSVPENGEVLRLEIPWDSETDQVADQHFNYAIHPGDEILVRPANSGAIHRMFKALGSGE